MMGNLKGFQHKAQHNYVYMHMDHVGNVRIRLLQVDRTCEGARFHQ